MLVYAAMAACSGGGAKTSGAGQAGHADAQGGDAMVAVAGAPNSASGAPSASEAGSGGLLDPVPHAGAQEGGGGPVGPVFGYREQDADCDTVLNLGLTDYPIAILDLDPPSLAVAAATIPIVHAMPTLPDGWLHRDVGGFVKPDGSQVAARCTSKQDSVTFLVPLF